MKATTELTTEPKVLSEMLPAELYRESADCRMTLESIYPYRCRDVSDRLKAIQAEINRRLPVCERCGHKFGILGRDDANDLCHTCRVNP